MNYYFYKVRRFLTEGAIPFTKIVLVLSGLNFILSALLRVFGLVRLNSMLILIPESLPRFFWTFLTYPLVNSDIFTLLFSGFWLWFVGGSLERTWGTKNYGFFFILVALVTGGAMALAAFFTNLEGYPINGLWLPLVGITWAWAKVYPEREVLIWGLLPVKARWLAWIDAGLIFFNYLQRVNLFFALASVSGIALVYLFGDSGPLGRGVHCHNWRQEDRYQTSKKKTRRHRLRIIK